MEFELDGSLNGLTEITEWAAKLGKMVAEHETDGDSIHASELRKEFAERLSTMPRNSIGGFYIFGDAAIVAYAQGYVSGLK